MIRSSKRGRKHKSLVVEADAWVRAIVFQRQGVNCLRCNQLKPLQAAHILAKGSHPSIHFDLENVIGLCLRCHIFWAHRDPIAFVDWIHQKFPGRIEKLKRSAAMPRRIDLKELICVLKAIYEQESTPGKITEPQPWEEPAF